MTTAGKGEDDFFRPPFDLAEGRRGRALDLELRHDGRLGQAEELGDHGRNLAVVGAHRLLAEQEEVRPGELPLHGPGDDAGRPQPVVGFGGIVLDQEGLVGAHGQALAEDDDGLVPAHRDDADRPALGFPEPQGFLDGVFVVGADDEVQPVLDDRFRFVLDPDPGFRVGDPLDEDENVHVSSPLEKSPAAAGAGLSPGRYPPHGLSNLLNRSEPLVPPKPKELLRPWTISAFRETFGT